MTMICSGFPGNNEEEIDSCDMRYPNAMAMVDGALYVAVESDGLSGLMKIPSKFHTFLHIH